MKSNILRIFKNNINFNLQNKLQFYNFCSINKKINIPKHNSSNISLVNINLGTIKDNPGANKKKIIVGRGPGCKKGKTSGKGHKGKQHGYKPPVFFQGGQTHLSKMLPKIDYIRKGIIYSEVNISRIVYLVKHGRLDPTKEINIKDLAVNACFGRIKEGGVKLLARGAEELKTIPPLNLKVNSASKQAIDCIKENGGSVTCEYKALLNLKYQLKPYKFNNTIRDPVARYRRVRQYLRLKDKGAKVIFNEPNWYKDQYSQIKEKLTNLKNKLDTNQGEYKYNLLPNYPVQRYKGMSNNKPRKPKKIIPRVIVFDGKAIK